MHISSITAPPPITPKAPLSQFVQRLAATLSSATSSPAQAQAMDAPALLTAERLRLTLLEMGEPGNSQNLALAEAFSRLGLALTRDTLAEANTALARAPGASPQAYALARAWELRTTPAALQALTAATGDAAIPPQQALSAELLSCLGLAADAGMEPEALMAHLYLLAQGTGRSTENRLATQAADLDTVSVQDARTILLRLAQGSADRGIQRGADALAAHIEGQQLINQVTRQGAEPGAFFLAVPVLFGEETVLAEMLLGVWDDEQEAGELPLDTPWLRATVRLQTTRLGRVQVSLTGTLAGRLTCRLGAEKVATVRLFQRHINQLTASLAQTGDWDVGPVECRVWEDWTPLWHGGDSLAAPRACVDWRA